MKWLTHASAHGAPGRRWLMLPGAYMKAADFIDAGFVAALAEAGLAHEAWLLDAQLGELADGSARRFVQDALAAAELPTWLLGISLGGHVALSSLMAGARPAGVLVLAPYLGPRDLVAAVNAPGAAPIAAGDPDADRQIWRGLQAETGLGCPVFLGWGLQDRFNTSHALMAGLLPAGRSDAVEGGHDWPTWSLLWRRHLETLR